MPLTDWHPCEGWGIATVIWVLAVPETLRAHTSFLFLPFAGQLLSSIRGTLRGSRALSNSFSVLVWSDCAVTVRFKGQTMLTLESISASLSYEILLEILTAKR
jgi:hypothetical protein